VPAPAAPFTLDWLSRPPFRELDPRLRGELAGNADWPALERYDELAGLMPHGPGVEMPRFVRQDRAEVTRQGGYERHVARLRAVPTRSESWHDFFNMVVWAHFPRLRWALNALHVDPDIGQQDPRNGRAPAQNLAATFDESGMLVVSTSAAVLAELRELRFKQAFWERREEVMATTRFFVVGHGALEALITPPDGLTARSLQLLVPRLPSAADADAFRCELDASVAARIEGWRRHRIVLDPVPLLAIPGFWPNDSAAFYDDLRNVRFVPVSRRAQATSRLTAG
jgi:hypothetical protein